MQNPHPTPGSDIYAAIVKAPFGAVGIRTEADTIRELVYLPHQFGDKPPENALAERTAQQLQSYFSDPDFSFTLPLAPAGTPFQRRVWQVIADIPRGCLLTYAQLARALNTAPRAVGQACGANWFPLVIPCHRVTASGALGGFAHSADPAGFALGVKRWLLAHEGASFPQ